MEDNLDLNYIFKKKVIKELISRYDYIKTLIQENLHKLDEDDFEENNINNPYEKRCMEIIERIKFLFDMLSIVLILYTINSKILKPFSLCGRK